MGSIAVCKKCKTWFDDTYYKDYCFICRKEVNSILEDIKAYIKENYKEQIGIMDVSEKFDVPIPQIISWINQGELELKKDFEGMNTCRKCGTPVVIGGYCDSCKKSLVNELSSNMNYNKSNKPSSDFSSVSKDNPKMRFVSNVHKR